MVIRSHEIKGGLNEFRTLARQAVLEGLSPEQVRFSGEIKSDVEQSAFQFGSTPEPQIAPRPLGKSTLTVPPGFLKLAEAVAYHASPNKWNLLYRILWRLQHENRALLELAIDDDIREAELMKKAVLREVHKIHAFVRFEKIPGAEGELESYVAWMETDHPAIEIAAPFFVRRFGDRRWSILTPQGSAFWDGETLGFGEGVPARPARAETLDDLWKAYYRSTFNPARIKLKAMRAEMPVRYWDALPETAIISELVRTAPERLTKMAQRQNQRAEVPETKDLDFLKRLSSGCRACPIGEHATQTVFGEGPQDARIMIVGEQPGDQEDQVGRPFVGPAGEVFNHALAKAQLNRSSLYVTNSVKHFKWKPGAPGKPRLHQKPSGSEMHACRPWLEREIDAVKPKVIVCMGATAATVLFGRVVKITEELGKVHTDSPWAERVIVTYHPSAILRALTDESRDQMRAALESALTLARELALEVEIPTT